MVIKRRKNPLLSLWEFNGSSFEQLSIPSTQGCFVPNLVEIGPAVLEKKMYKFPQWTFTILWLSPLGKRRHCANFGWNWPCGSVEEDFFNFVNVLSLFRNHLPLEKVRPSIWTNLNPPHPRIVTSLVEIAHLFRRRRFFNCINVFSLFCNYLPLEKGWALHLNKLESPSPKDALCQVWLKLALWFWRRFFNFVNDFSLFFYHLPLEKGGALHLNKFESPSPKDAMCRVWWKLTL